MYINLETSDLSKKEGRKLSAFKGNLEQKTSAFISSYIIYTTCNISSYRSMKFEYSKTLHVCLNVLSDSLAGRFHYSFNCHVSSYLSLLHNGRCAFLSSYLAPCESLVLIFRLLRIVRLPIPPLPFCIIATNSP